MGMKQRLGIAIALLNHPKLLILGEPTNGLDPIEIQDLRKLIKSFPEQGITVIFSSHISSGFLPSRCPISIWQQPFYLYAASLFKFSI